MGTIVENSYAFRSPGGLQFGVVDSVPVASAAAMPAPRALISTVTGSAAISTITTPYPGFTGFIILVAGAAAAFTFATGGTPSGQNLPIGSAIAAATPGAGKILVCDGNAWYPA